MTLLFVHAYAKEYRFYRWPARSTARMGGSMSLLPHIDKTVLLVPPPTNSLEYLHIDTSTAREGA